MSEHTPMVGPVDEINLDDLFDTSPRNTPSNGTPMKKPKVDDLGGFFDTTQDGPRTRPVIAHDVAGFIERSFHEALPYQYLREFVVNAKEAGATKVIIEPDWLFIENCVARGVKPVYRLSVWDNGSGMDEKLLNRFRHMFSTSKGNMRGRHDNYGMGGKISSMPCNPNGLIVMSWQNGEGNMIILHKDPKTDQYGLFLQEVEATDGSIRYLEVVPTPVQYDNFYDTDGKLRKRLNGTLIIFTGISPTDNTFLGPSQFNWGRNIKTNTLTLNTRFADLSGDEFEVLCYEVGHLRHQDWPTCRADASTYKTTANGNTSSLWRYGQYRRIRGCKIYWDEASTHDGIVEIPDGKVYWWLFGKTTLAEAAANDGWRASMGLPRIGDTKMDKNGVLDTLDRVKTRHSYTPASGMVGILYKNEIYDLRNGGAVHHLYNYFGIYDSEVRKRLVLIVEPNYTENSGIWPNAVRSGLEYVGEDKLPWVVWGTQFNAVMPDVLKEMIESDADSFMDSESFRDRIEDNVKKALTELGLRTGTGTGTQKKPQGDRDPTPRPPSNNPGSAPHRRQKAVGLHGKGALDWQIIPAQKMREAQRPVAYIEQVRRVDVFEGHSIFQAAIHKWQNRYEGQDDTVMERVRSTVMECYLTSILVRIAHVLSLEGTLYYSHDDVAAMLSGEALSTGVAGFDLDTTIRQKLSGRLNRNNKNS